MDYLKRNIASTKEMNEAHLPEFFRLNNQTDKENFFLLLQHNPHLKVHDEIIGQIKEYIKLLAPKKTYSAIKLEEAVKEQLGSLAPEEYGVWVYFPWNDKVVHILDEAEFIEVRTNRNQHKIIKEERETLSCKKIGIIGLSVGQSVALTMAQERIFGELRIADYDILELSNYNRIRTGLFNLGQKKTITVAREISEIDPFLKITLFNEGINEENIEMFLCSGGKLDLLIDECDGLDVKILCRQKAKKLNIPVVMEASDRGTIDIERFDLEPERSILHGYIDHLDINNVKNLKTNEEKVPFLLPILGPETISKKGKASMLEVGQTITTWPQLASAVVMGGGITTDVCRRILLDEFTDSGRYFVDPEEIVKNKNKESFQQTLNLVPLISQEQAEELISLADLKEEVYQELLSDETIKAIVEAGVSAPTGANAQPWKWIYKEKTLYLFFDIAYKAELLDFEGTTSFIGLGMAAENIILKAHSFNLDVRITKFPIKGNTTLVAAFGFYKADSNKKPKNVEKHVCDSLAAMIPLRTTNRKICDRKVLTDNVLKDLELVASTIPNASLQFITDPADLNKAGEIIARLDRFRIMHPGGHKDFLAEMRWTAEQAEYTKNGVDITTIEMTPSERVGFEMAKDWEAINYLNKWKKGTALEKFSRKLVASASAIGLIKMPKYSPLGFFEGGRAAERVWLSATEKNIAFQPLSIATLIYNTYLHEKRPIFSEEMKKELEELRKDFLSLFSIEQDSAEVLLFRLFLTEYTENKSKRVPVEQVLTISSTL